MASNLYLTVFFEMQSSDQMKALELLIEHLDLCDFDDAKALLEKNDLKSAQDLISQLTQETDYSHYKDLIRLYTDTYNVGVDNMELHIDDSGTRGTIEADGLDKDSDAFCSSVVLILVAMKAKNIQAEGGSSRWAARWKQLADGSIQFNQEWEE